MSGSSRSLTRSQSSSSRSTCPAVTRSRSRRSSVERDGEVGAEVEEVVLDLLEPGPELVGKRAGEREPENRVQLVDGPVRLDAEIGLRDAAPVAETGLARVSGSGVDPRQPYGLVPASRHGGEYRDVAAG